MKYLASLWQRWTFAPTKGYCNLMRFRRTVDNWTVGAAATRDIFEAWKELAD